jgi:hypothetical protein
MADLEIADEPAETYREKNRGSGFENPDYSRYEVVEYVRSGRSTSEFAVRQVRVTETDPVDDQYIVSGWDSNLDRLRLLARLLDETDLRIEDLPDEGSDADRYVDSGTPVPAALVGSGSAAVAAYLRAMFDGSNEQIARVLDVGERTVETYVSDVRSGDRL